MYFIFGLPAAPLSPHPMPEYAILRIAIPCPLYGLFDYRLPEQLPMHPIVPGMRVLIPFGKRQLIGIIVEQTEHSDIAPNKLRSVISFPDTKAVFSTETLALLQWAAQYYLHPPGKAIQAALPVYLRHPSHYYAPPDAEKPWRVASTTADTLQQLQRRAPKQHQLYQLLATCPQGLTTKEIRQRGITTGTITALHNKSLINQKAPSRQSSPTAATSDPQMPLVLNTEQQQAVKAISQSNTGIHCLFGVTGSGKTEVYLEISQQTLSRSQQVLLLVPEISLTPQLTQRFASQLHTRIAVLHSGLSASQRYRAWYAAANGEARVVIGTRSSIFTPMPDLGLIIIDEEHDGSYKQQDGFRYNARDLAIIRARYLNCPVILGSATPSLETINNINEQRYQVHYLRQRANTRPLPAVKLINLCNQRMHEGLSESLLEKIEQHIRQRSQVLLFINRRGFAPLLMCHRCGWTARCHRCDANMTYHMKYQRLHCHHCNAQRPVPEQCDHCGSDEMIAVGSGTERIEQFLQLRFPQTAVNRIDRDTTRNKGCLQEKLRQAHSGESGILVGTQMLAKGHDFPGITLVGILDTDQSLYSSDFRAGEHLAQLIIQVSGRAGRAEKTGEVLIQTHHPEHPLLQTLLHQGYESFSHNILAERKNAALPPEQHLIIIRSESTTIDAARHFLDEVASVLAAQKSATVEIFGPLPAPMERRAGRYRYQLMLQARHRKPLHQILHNSLGQIIKLKSTNKARWSIDVDPYDTF